jgi:hypothetical protein
MIGASARPSIEKPHSLRTLLSGGDWACNNNQAGALAEVVRLLGPCVAAPDQLELGEIARLATTDMTIATTRWALVCTRLRSQLLDESPSLEVSEEPS